MVNAKDILWNLGGKFLKGSAKRVGTAASAFLIGTLGLSPELTAVGVTAGIAFAGFLVDAAVYLAVKRGLPFLSNGSA